MAIQIKYMTLKNMHVNSTKANIMRNMYKSLYDGKPHKRVIELHNGYGIPIVHGVDVDGDTITSRPAYTFSNYRRKNYLLWHLKIYKQLTFNMMQMRNFTENLITANYILKLIDKNL